MLNKLYIKNYALIEEVDITFSQKMTIITGETGAGKSILLGALSLILGQRADTGVLHNAKSKCIVEGTFDITSYKLKPFFEKAELDYEPITHIRREITPSGKSRAFINDTPVRLNTLKSLSDQLVNLHAQHQTLHLYDAQYQLFLIDTLARHFTLLNGYKTDYRAYTANCRKCASLEAQNAQLQRDLDYLLFQLSELEEADLDNADEQDALEQELDQLNNAETIKSSLLESVYLLEENEPSIIEQLHTIKAKLAETASYHPLIAELNDRLNSVIIELQDINGELSNLGETAEMDPQRTEIISERLNTIYRLQKKHQVSTVAELIDIQNNLQEQSQSINDLEAEIQALQKMITAQKKQLLKKAQQISANRKKQIPVFEKKVGQMLAKVGMPNARLQPIQKTLPANTFNINGIDDIELLFSANKGSRPAELRKVASGGELSRLMLSIQSLIAANTTLPTLLFDEIDTGISGEVALKVGNVLKKLATNHQVICITHLPQIASKADAHYFVYKKDTANRTLTQVKALSHPERIVEIAKMLSGDKPGQMALANAKELIGENR